MSLSVADVLEALKKVATPSPWCSACEESLRLASQELRRLEDQATSPETLAAREGAAAFGKSAFVEAFRRKLSSRTLPITEHSPEEAIAIRSNEAMKAKTTEQKKTVYSGFLLEIHARASNAFGWSSWSTDSSTLNLCVQE